MHKTAKPQETWSQNNKHFCLQQTKDSCRPLRGSVSIKTKQCGCEHTVYAFGWWRLGPGDAARKTTRARLFRRRLWRRPGRWRVPAAGIDSLFDRQELAKAFATPMQRQHNCSPLAVVLSKRLKICARLARDLCTFSNTATFEGKFTQQAHLRKVHKHRILS